VRDGKKLRSIAEPSSNAEISDVVEETEAVGSVEEKENVSGFEIHTLPVD
jgi:hypothetical protein